MVKETFIIAGTMLALTFVGANAVLPPLDSAPDFKLEAASGKTLALESYKGKYVVLEWWNNGCPVVQKHYRSGNIPALQKEFIAKGAVWLTIVSSAPGKQGHVTVENANAVMKQMAGVPSDILLDPTGVTGRAYKAKASPQIVLISPKGEMLYNGAIDDNPGANGADILKSKNYLRQAWDEVHAGKAVSVPSTPAYGCGIKY